MAFLFYTLQAIWSKAHILGLSKEIMYIIYCIQIHVLAHILNFQMIWGLIGWIKRQYKHDWSTSTVSKIPDFLERTAS